MSDIFDLTRKKDKNFDEYTFLQNLSADERKRYFEINESVGLAAPTEDGVLTEAGEAFAQSLVTAGRGLGATMNELGLGSGVQDYFSEMLARNQQWNAPQDMGTGTYIARAIGSAAGSSAGVLGAGIAGSMINPAVGLAAGLTAGFSQTFGDNVQRNREAGYSEEKAFGMAFLESAVDTAIENAPWGIVGKGAKTIGRMHRISAAGKKELLNKIGQRMAAQVGQKEAQNLLWKWAKQTTLSGLGESGEEGLQYLNSYINQKLGGDPNAEFSLDELADVMAQGFIGGFGMGGVQNIAGIRHDAKMRKLANAPEAIETAEGSAGNVQTPADSNGQVPDQTVIDNNSDDLLSSIVRGVGEEFGVKVDYIDNYKGNKKLESSDGFYDEETDTIYLDRNDNTNDLGVSLGHEFKHMLDKNHPELVKVFDDIWQSGQTAEGKAFFKQLAEEWKLPEDIQQKEFSAEAFGQIFVRPGTWRSYTQALEQHSPGMGEKFVKVLQEFIQAIKKQLAGIVQPDPETETLFNNVAAMEAEAGKILAEVRRQNGNASQVENVVGAKGNTNVETVPVSQINVDAEPMAQLREEAGIKVESTEENGGVRSGTDKPVVKENLTTETAATAEEASEVEETPEVKSAFANLKDRSAEIGFTFNKFYKDFAPQLDAIIAKERRSFEDNLGNDIESDWWNAANDAMVKAYMAFDPETGYKISTLASTAVVNAINSVKRKHQRNSNVTGGNISLDQTNEHGEALSEAVADERVYSNPDSISLSQDTEEALKKIAESNLTNDEKKILKLRFGDKLSNSEIRRKLGKKFGKNGHEYMTEEEYRDKMAVVADKLVDMGIEYRRKREGREGKPIVNIMPEVPSNLDLKDTQNVKRYLKSLFAGSKFRIKSDGRPTAINANGIEAAVKKRGISRQSLFDAQNIVENSYPVGYEYADLKHLNKTQNINGQFIYVSLVDINNKPFAAVIKLDDFANDEYAKFKDIAVKEITPAVRGSNDKIDLANPPVQVSDITIQYLVDFVKQHFKENKSFTENVAEVFEKRLDDAYFAALNRGDTESASAMVKNAAKRSIYHEDSDYQGSLAFNGSAPSKNGNYESKEARKEAWDNGDYEGEFSFGDFVDNGIDTHDLDWQLTNPTAYRIADKYGRESIRNLQSAIKNPQRTINIYRAVDANIKENSIRNGDWVTPSKSYAEQHIDLQDWESGRIIEQEVSIDDLWWNGDDINEWGYDDGESYAYANTPNNRKLLDTVTYDSNGNIIPLSKRFNKRVDDVNYRRKRLHRQINPIVVDGNVRDEYADLLNRKGYTPTTLKELQDKALDWILKQGGIVPAAESIIANKAPANSAVAEIARRFILNSEVFANDVSYEDRVKLSTIEMDERSRAGLTLRSMRLDSLNLKDVASVQALLNKLHEDVPPADLRKLRQQIKNELGIDIYDLPKNIVDDKQQLDALLRMELAHKANWKDKLYEYWINSILSGPSTHAANLLGNTANAAYELGIKRFTEALINTVAGRKGGATFQEFKEMARAFNWSNAVKAFKEARDLEVIDPSGKFMENRNVAIGGKLGRAVRYPGRLLNAADALAKAIIEPMETAAYACRLGVGKGLSGNDLQNFVQKQLTDKNSQSYQWGKERAKELAFQEDPGYFVNALMALRETPGFMGTALRIVLPFIKTPTNILLQGARKSPLGIFPLIFVDTVSRIKNKQGFDGEYIAKAAEQIIAWGAFMAIYGMGDDDELPFITGSSAPYGSAEYGFKANKVPPYSIRIGDTWYSYKRIEPLATGLAVIADSIQALKNARNGKDGMAVIKDLFRGAKQIVVEKSFLDSLGEMQKVADDPQNFVRAVTNPARGLVPNIFTQMRQAFDENVQDNKSREKGLEWFKDQFFIVTNRAGITAALPKIDYFGREVKKDDWGDTPFSFLGRLTPVKRIEADSNFDKAERLIWNYNQNNPDETWYPAIPQPTFSRNKQKYYFSGENYTDYAKDAGRLAQRQINNAIAAGRLNVNSPGKDDIALIKKIFSRARKETIDKHFSKAKKY